MSLPYYGACFCNSHCCKIKWQIYWKFMHAQFEDNRAKTSHKNEVQWQTRQCAFTAQTHAADYHSQAHDLTCNGIWNKRSVSLRPKHLIYSIQDVVFTAMKLLKCVTLVEQRQARCTHLLLQSFNFRISSENRKWVDCMLVNFVKKLFHERCTVPSSSPLISDIASVWAAA